MVRVDGQTTDDHARFGQIRPADGTAAPPWPSNDPQRRAQLNNYRPLEMSGPSTAGSHTNDHATATKQTARQSEQKQVPASNMAPLTVPQTGRPTAPPLIVAGALPGSRAPLGKGMFPNGEPLGTPGKTNHKKGKDGKDHIVTVATPGTESYVGRWDLSAGGGFSLKDRQTLYDGSRQTTREFSFPAKSDVLVINANGTWFKQFAGKKTNGSWFDLGQNVVQLGGFEDEDWTGSVKDGQLTIRGPVGNWEYGKRF